MTLEHVFRLHDLGKHAEAYSELRKLREDPATCPHLVRALAPLEAQLAALVPAPSALAWVGGLFARKERAR